MTTALLTEVDARSLLGRLEAAFVDGHLHAWAQWRRFQALCDAADATDLYLPLTATTRANFLNNHCVERVVTLLEPLLDPAAVRVTDAAGFTCVLVMDGKRAALVRFKLLDRDLRTRNVATGRQLNFDRQEWDSELLIELEIPGAVEPTGITCGYVLAKDETAIESIYLICKQNGTTEWAYSIHGERKDVVVDIPLPDAPPRTARVVSKRARRKSSDEKKGAESDGEA